MSNSGKDIVYLAENLGNSAMDTLLFQSSADPVCLASIMPKFLIFYTGIHSKPVPAIKPRIPGLHPGARDRG